MGEKFSDLPAHLLIYQYRLVSCAANHLCLFEKYLNLFTCFYL